MRIVAILANLILLAFVATIIIKSGLPGREDAGFFIALVSAPLLSILALALHGKLRFPELLSLEVQARKAKLRQQIAEAEARASLAATISADNDYSQPAFSGASTRQSEPSAKSGGSAKHQVPATV